MKKLSLALAAGLLAVAGSAQAQSEAFFRDLALSQVSGVHVANIINWKVGEFQDMNLGIQGLPFGTMHKEATSEEGNAIWVASKMSGSMIGEQTVETLIDRADGHIIKMKQNGKETTPPEDKIEIIDQETATITVPAGTFETIHIRAKSQKSGNIEVWANPQAITLDGTAKMTTAVQSIPVSIELTKFGGR